MAGTAWRPPGTAASMAYVTGSQDRPFPAPTYFLLQEQASRARSMTFGIQAPSYSTEGLLPLGLHEGSSPLVGTPAVHFHQGLLSQTPAESLAAPPLYSGAAGLSRMPSPGPHRAQPALCNAPPTLAALAHTIPLPHPRPSQLKSCVLVLQLLPSSQCGWGPIQGVSMGRRRRSIRSHLGLGCGDLQQRVETTGSAIPIETDMHVGVLLDLLQPSCCGIFV